MTKKKVEKPRCTFCQTDKYLSLFWRGVTTWEHQGRFNFVKCTQCGLVFQSPRVPFSEAVSYYPSESYWGRDVRKAELKPGWKKEREKAFGFLYRGIFKRKNKGTVLDIGSGLGLFLSKFKELGWRVVGTDISSDVAGYSKRVFGVKVLIGDVTKMILPDKHFDLVTLNGVFEHIYNPRETLYKIKKVLKDRGLLVIVVPNIESLGYSIHKKEWYHLQPGRHIYQFSSSTITKLLLDTGFKVEEISHSYWAHNYYSLYENFRFRFSPRFKKAKGGGLAKGSPGNLSKPAGFSLIKEIGKVVGAVLAFTGSIVEPVIGKGEVITVYAKKA